MIEHELIMAVAAPLLALARRGARRRSVVQLLKLSALLHLVG
jgi:cytochrome c oxidase assembly factor CtaG